MFTHRSLTDTKPCSLSHLLVIPVWVASVRASLHGPFLLSPTPRAAFREVPSLRRFLILVPAAQGDAGLIDSFFKPGEKAKNFFDIILYLNFIRPQISA